MNSLSLTRSMPAGDCRGNPRHRRLRPRPCRWLVGDVTLFRAKYAAEKDLRQKRGPMDDHPAPRVTGYQRTWKRDKACSCGNHPDWKERDTSARSQIEVARWASQAPPTSAMDSPKIATLPQYNADYLAGTELDGLAACTSLGMPRQNHLARAGAAGIGPAVPALTGPPPSWPSMIALASFFTRVGRAGGDVRWRRLRRMGSAWLRNAIANSRVAFATQRAAPRRVGGGMGAGAHSPVSPRPGRQPQAAKPVTESREARGPRCRAGPRLHSRDSPHLAAGRRGPVTALWSLPVAVLR